MTRNKVDLDLDGSLDIDSMVQQVLDKRSSLTGLTFSSGIDNPATPEATKTQFSKFLQALTSHMNSDNPITFPELNTFTFVNDKKLRIEPENARLIIELLKSSKQIQFEFVFHSDITPDAFEYIMYEICVTAAQRNAFNENVRGHANSTRLTIEGSNLHYDHFVRFAKIMPLSKIRSIRCVLIDHLDDAAMQVFAESLHHNTTLQELFMLKGELGAAGVEAIAGMLRCNKGLKKLVLGCFNIGDEGVKGIALSLSENSTLEELLLPSVGCGIEGLIFLAESLTHNKTLKGLCLVSNEIGNDGNSEGLNALADCLPVNKTLSGLDLSLNHLSSLSLDYLFGKLSSRTVPLELCLEANGFGDDFINTLSCCNAPLLSLKLGHNQLCSRHIETLARGIQEGTFDLKSLALDSFTATYDSIINFISSLCNVDGKQRPPCSMTELSLSSMSGVPNTTYIAIFCLLYSPSSNSNLQELSFNSNDELCSACIQFLALQMGLYDKKLVSLSIEDVGLDDSGLISLVGALSSDTKMTKLCIAKNNNITKLGKEALYDLLYHGKNMTLKEISLVDSGYEALDDKIYFYARLNKYNRQDIIYNCRMDKQLLYLYLTNKKTVGPSLIYWILQTCPTIFVLS